MRSVTQLKSMKDIRSPISAHVRSAPRQKGTSFLEVFLLDKERQRLETELAMLAKRQQRVNERVEEIRETIAKQLSKAQPTGAAPAGSPAPLNGGHSPSQANGARSPKWKQVTVEY